MKKLIIAGLIITALTMSCKTTRAVASAVDFSGVTGKDWKLTEVWVNGRNIDFNRNASANRGLGEIYTVKFDAENINGTGAPNLYSSPYTLGNNQAIEITLVRSTLMASISEPANLREHDYFNYVQKVYEWKLADNKLELLSKPQDGSNVRLVFSL